MPSLDPRSPLPPLKSFSVTHILYDPAHPLSIPLTLLSLSPIFLFVSYFTLVIFTRRLTVLLLAAGQLANELLSWVLKRILKGERPYLGHGEVGTGYGMPSSHAQAAGFLVAWGLGYAATLSKRGGGRAAGGGGVEAVRRWRVRVYVLGLLVWSLGVSYSRWHLHYHSPVQIVAGYGVGVASGCVWFVATEYMPLQGGVSGAGRVRATAEWLWEAVGGVGGWELGDAAGGWGEGWLVAGGGAGVATAGRGDGRKRR